MAALEASFPVRIAKIGDRFLIFEPEVASLLRRRANLNGVLIGTAPQQPTQNIFLGLPVELRPEEVSTLVQQGVAYVVDDAAAHRATLHSFQDPERKGAYIDSLRTRRQAAQAALSERQTQRAAEVAGKIKASKQKANVPQESVDQSRDEDVTPQSDQNEVKHLAVTPTSSIDMISEQTNKDHTDNDVADGPLCRHLQAAGYHMTPGLRFGSNYSVYPGDPLRFHAHFMANEYDWDEEISILDIVGGGRLATAVKKAFLIGGLQPSTLESPTPTVRTFSIEWATM